MLKRLERILSKGRLNSKSLKRLEQQEEQFVDERLIPLGQLLHALQTNAHGTLTRMVECKMKSQKRIELIMLTLFHYAEQSGVRLDDRVVYWNLHLIKQLIDDKMDQEFSKYHVLCDPLEIFCTKHELFTTFIVKQLLNQVVLNVSDSKFIDVDVVSILKKYPDLPLDQIVNMEEDPESGHLLITWRNAMTRILTNMLNVLSRNVAKFPYPIRWMCKRLFVSQKNLCPQLPDEDHISSIFTVLFERYLLPRFSSPGIFDIVSYISTDQGRRLSTIRDIFSALVQRSLFQSHPLAHLLTDMYTTQKPLYNQFIFNLIDVEEPNQTLFYSSSMERRPLRLQITVQELNLLVEWTMDVVTPCDTLHSLANSAQRSLEICTFSTATLELYPCPLECIPLPRPTRFADVFITSQ